MSAELAKVSHYFEHNELYAALNPFDRSRAMSAVYSTHIKARTQIYDCGETGDRFYYLVEGEVVLTQGKKTHVVKPGQYFGSEIGLGVETHTHKAVAKKNSLVMVVRQKYFQKLIKQNPEALPILARETLSLDLPKAIHLKHHVSKHQEIKTLFTIFSEHYGWFILAVMAPLLYYVMTQLSNQTEIQFFGTAVGITALMWVLNLMPEFVPALFVAIAFLALNIAPVKTVLGTLSSPTFMMMIADFGIGFAVIKSGLLYRFLLRFLEMIHKKYYTCTLGLFSYGALLSLFVPSVNTRCEIMGNLTSELKDIFRLKSADKENGYLATSIFSGTTLFATSIMNSSLSNFIVMILLPPQEQARISWGNWFLFMLVATTITFVGYVVCSYFFFRFKRPINIDISLLKIKRKTLGALTKNEKWVMLGLMVVSLGMATYSYHGVHPAWLSMTVFFSLMVLGVFSDDDFERGINWSYIIYVGASSGIAATFRYLGLDSVISDYFFHLAGSSFYNDYYFIIFMMLITITLRLFLPIAPTAVLVASIFIPIAHSYNNSGWVTCVVMLICSDIFFFPQQSRAYEFFRESAETRSHESSILKFNFLMSIVRIVSILGSIPYWFHLGLL